MPIQHCSAEIIFGKVSSTTGALFQIKCKQDKFFFYSNSSHEVEIWINEINMAKEYKIFFFNLNIYEPVFII